ncbi:hypothetical protein [Maribacter sp. IgM3_T14_3]|uniref:hypothetical protein n=1 Tax=Maribacter sp. IgM3_T14_3 TaxID=3415140 RepID=UPI003C6EF39E
MVQKNIVILISFFIFYECSIAQEPQDSLQEKQIKQVKERFPKTSLLNFDISESLNRNFSSEFLNQNLNDGVITNQRNYIFSTNIPLYKKVGWELSTFLSYQFNQFKFQNLQNNSSFEGVPVLFEQDNTVNFHYLSAEFTAEYFTYLFKKLPIKLTVSAIADSNEQHLGRIKGSLGFLLFLKGTNRTLIGLGALGNIDSSSQNPVLPLFLYKHQFRDLRWELIFLLPRMLYLRKLMGEKGRLSLGSTFGSDVLYVNSNHQSLVNLLEYNQLELKAGLLYEHRFNDFLVGKLEAGVHKVFNSILLEKGAAASNYIYENRQDATTYFKLGISINPFANKTSN